MTKTQSLNTLLDATKTSGDNIAKAKVISGKQQDTLFISSALPGSRGKTGFVEGKTRIDMSQGEISATGVEGDFAISGNGMIVVDAGGKRTYSTVTSFRVDKDGKLVNAAGNTLLGWKLDQAGNKPIDGTLLSSLDAVNIYGFDSKPQATGSVRVTMNLDASAQKLKGAGRSFKVNQGGLNVGLKEDEIIVPEVLGTSSMQQGDTFTMTSNPPNQTKIFVYGGITGTKDITANNGFYQSTGVDRQFAFAAPGVVAATALAANQVTEDMGVVISVDGTTTQIKLKHSPNTGRNEFNSLNSLRDVLKNIPGVTARIIGNKLWIAGTDGNKAITFANLGGGNIVETFGLQNIPQAPANQLRFATFKALKTQINLQSEVTGIEATSIPGGSGLDIHSLKATSSFSIQGSSRGEHTITQATLGNNTEQGRASITITSPLHCLKTGDYVQISQGLHANAPAGRYMVGSVTGDTFQIYLMAPGAAPAVAPLAVLPVPPDTTWTKIAGQEYQRFTPTAVALNGADVQLTFNAHDLANGDIVWISGIGLKQIGGGQDVGVADGYYVVAAVAGNTIDITPTTAPAVHAPAVPALNPNDVSVQKFGSGGALPVAGGVTMNAIETTIAAGGNPARVRVHLPNNNYSIGDYIKFTGIFNGSVIVGGATLNNNQKYKIANRDANFVDLELDPTWVVANGVATYANVANNVGPDFRIDYYSRTFEYLGLDQEKELFASTYDAGDSFKSLSGGKHDAGKIFSHAFTVVDTLGQEHQVVMRFAKVDLNTWACEIASVKNPAGDYDIVVDRIDGVIKTGTIQFATDGSLLTPGQLIEPININWKNGSAASHLTFDWGSIGGVLARGIGARDGITQVRAPSAASLNFKADGNTAGAMVSFEIGEDGMLTFNFDNGTTQSPFQIPLAIAPNMAGLRPSQNGTYFESRDSGAMVLGVANTGGRGQIIPRAIELSNVDTTKGLLEVKDLGDAVQANARVLHADHINFKTILSETQG